MSEFLGEGVVEMLFTQDVRRDSEMSDVDEDIVQGYY
jgi:hypothetical protein